jgi:hypothetical protein
MIDAPSEILRECPAIDVTADSLSRKPRIFPIGD